MGAEGWGCRGGRGFGGGEPSPFLGGEGGGGKGPPIILPYVAVWMMARHGQLALVAQPGDPGRPKYKSRMRFYLTVQWNFPRHPAPDFMHGMMMKGGKVAIIPNGLGSAERMTPTQRC